MQNVLRVMLRPAFGLCLAASQFTASRTSIFTEHVWLLAAGAILLVAGVWLWVSASFHLRRAVAAQKLATDGPYCAVRHPIYASIYLLSIGLGLIFFAWLWFVVLVAFLPLWRLECHREEREQIERWGETYVDYQQRTALLIPGLW